MNTPLRSSLRILTAMFFTYVICVSILFVQSNMISTAFKMSYPLIMFLVFCALTCIMMLYEVFRIPRGPYLAAILAVLSVLSLSQAVIMFAFSMINPLIVFICILAFFVLCLFFYVLYGRLSRVHILYILIFLLNIFSGMFILASNVLHGSKTEVIIKRELVQVYAKSPAHTFYRTSSKPYSMFLFDQGRRMGVFEWYGKQLVLVDLKKNRVIKRLKNICNSGKAVKLSLQTFIFPEAQGVGFFSARERQSSLFVKVPVVIPREGDNFDERYVQLVMYDPAHRRLVAALNNGEIYLYAMRNKKILKHFSIYDGVNLTTWSPFERFVQGGALLDSSKAIVYTWARVYKIDYLKKKVIGEFNGYGAGGNVILDDDRTHFYGTNMLLGVLYEVSVDDMRLSRFWFIKPGLRFIAKKGTDIFCTNHFSGELSLLDTKTGRVSPVAVTLPRTEEIIIGKHAIYVSHVEGVSAIAKGSRKVLSVTDYHRAFPFNLDGFPGCMFRFDSIKISFATIIGLVLTMSVYVFCVGYVLWKRDL